MSIIMPAILIVVVLIIGKIEYRAGIKEFTKVIQLLKTNTQMRRLASGVLSVFRSQKQAF